MSDHIDPRLEKYIATRDKRLAKDNPWSPTRLADTFLELMKNGTVKVGGRATCGTSTDPSWREFSMWNEVVRKARSLGYVITEESIKHGNGWATKAGGFWDEREYRIEVATEEAA